MKAGDTILVLPSIALSNLKLEALAGTYGTIIEVCVFGDRFIGCWVRFNFEYLDENEWFIPYNSIVT